MAADAKLKQQLAGLRVDTGRKYRRRRDPFADFSEDDSDDNKDRRSRSQTKQAAAPEKEKPVAPAKTSVSTTIDAIRGSDGDLLATTQRLDRRPSPAPSQLPLSRVIDSNGRRGSIDSRLQSIALNGRAKTSKNPRAAVAQAAGALAYLDDTDDDEEALPRPQRTDRHPSPAPRKQSDSVDPLQRTSSPRGSRELPREAAQAVIHPVQPSVHTVASPFAGTKYLQDSDSEEEAIASRKSSVESTPGGASLSPEKQAVEVRRVDKPKPQDGGGVSWRAFSAGRAEQRHTEIQALQTSLKQRGKSISFGSHAVTDDGNRVPIQPTPEQIFAATAGSSRGRQNTRGKSPPRRVEDTKPTDDEIADGGGSVGIYDPTQFKTNPFTGNLSDEPEVMETERQSPTEMISSSDLQALPAASLPFASTISPTSDTLMSPSDYGGLENSTGSLTSKSTVSPPQTIPEGRQIDHALSPLVSPTNETTSPISRNSSTRSTRLASSRPTRIPGANSRRSSRRSTSANTSFSPAHAFLSSWSKDAGASEPAPEPKPDDEGQAIGLNNEYIIGRTVNQGGFGVIKEVHTINTAGENVIQAVKIVRKAIQGKNEAENERAQQELEHEVSVWRHLKHRHVLDLKAVYDTDFATFCVMDLNSGGTLFDLVRKSRAGAAANDGRRGLEPKLAKSYAYQLASALRYLHEDIRVCHRDVKLENCLIDMSGANSETEGGNLRLCDFGLADFLHSETIDEISAERFGSPANCVPSMQNLTKSSIIGTLEYASPKGLSVNRKLFETAGDVWAFGVIVYALCTGELPFRHAMPSKTVEMILRADWDNTALVSAAAGGSEVKELVQGCLERDIDIRLTIAEALRSKWFEGCAEALGEEETASVWR